MVVVGVICVVGCKRIKGTGCHVSGGEVRSVVFVGVWVKFSLLWRLIGLA